MKFFVNFLSAFRIAASFAIIPTLMFQMYWTTFILYTLAAMKFTSSSALLISVTGSNWVISPSMPPVSSPFIMVL
ncbi:MAG: hypothetical protein J6S12_01535, partial [Alphaproteobacteria bacterium]|nr:hypothetical protein [Alphaproteobacteria bacterium]